MALIMVTTMAVFMVVGMWSMFKNTKTNIALLIGFLALFTATLLLGRVEAGVGNEGFLAHPNRGCRSWGLKPPVSSRLRAM